MKLIRLLSKSALSVSTFIVFTAQLPLHASTENQSNASEAATAQPTKQQALLVEGRNMLEKGDQERAITQAFDPVIQYFEREFKDAKERIYSAQSMQQSLMYLASAAAEKSPAKVLDSTWADAYLLKGYALVELKRTGEAQKALEAAVALSPMSSQYLSELAYLFQVQGDCAKSIATYVEAESMADLGSDDETKLSDKTRALRGQGYCLVEQGKLSEAEALYRKCLTLDPGDTKALGELEYIKSHRAK